MEKNVLANGYVFHELSQRPIVWLDMFQNLRVFDVFADSIDLQGRYFPVLAQTLGL